MSTMQIMARAEVLGTPIDALYITDSTEHQVELSNNTNDETTKCKLKKQTMLVYGRPENPEQLSLADLVGQLGSLFTGGFMSENDIKSKLPEKLVEKISEIKFSIRVIYFSKVKATLHTIPGDGEDSEDKTKDSGAEALINSNEKDSEYAVWVDVHLNKNLMADFPISVSGLSFKVWQTNNQKVLGEMEITASNQLLEGAGITSVE